MMAGKDELSQSINELLISTWRGGALNAVKAITDLLEEDERAGVPVSLQRVITHIRQVAAESETATPPELS